MLAKKAAKLVIGQVQVIRRFALVVVGNSHGFIDQSPLKCHDPIREIGRLRGLKLCHRRFALIICNRLSRRCVIPAKHARCGSTLLFKPVLAKKAAKLVISQV